MRASRAWAPVAVNRDNWTARQGTCPTYVAEAGGEIVGFSDLEPDGNIDMLFVYAGHQGRGVVRALLDHIHAHANALGINRLFTDASIAARPFFKHNGFKMIEACGMRGQTFRNYPTAKNL